MYQVFMVVRATNKHFVDLVKCSALACSVAANQDPQVLRRLGTWIYLHVQDRGVWCVTDGEGEIVGLGRQAAFDNSHELIAHSPHRHCSEQGLLCDALC